MLSCCVSIPLGTTHFLPSATKLRNRQSESKRARERERERVLDQEEEEARLESQYAVVKREGEERLLEFVTLWTRQLAAGEAVDE